MQTSVNTSPKKAHSARFIGSLVILGLVVLGPFLFYGWLVMIDTSGTFHNVTDVADLDGDGDLDALVGTEMETLLWINQGKDQSGQEGIFALDGQTLPGKKIRAVFLSDFDMDGDSDALSAGIRQAVIWWNDGQASFTQSSQRFRYTERHGAAVGDFNGDNLPDIFIAEYYKTYTLWLNQGDSRFRAVR